MKRTLRPVLLGVTFLIGCVGCMASAIHNGTKPGPITVTVQESDARKVYVGRGDHLNVIMDRHHPDAEAALVRCVEMHGHFVELGFICEDVDF